MTLFTSSNLPWLLVEQGLIMPLFGVVRGLALLVGVGALSAKPPASPRAPPPAPSRVLPAHLRLRSDALHVANLDWATAPDAVEAALATAFGAHGALRSVEVKRLATTAAAAATSDPSSSAAAGAAGGGGAHPSQLARRRTRDATKLHGGR